VVLQIDTSQPLLRPSQLTDLVRAVRGADSHDEHRWIEWKSGLDLTTAAGLAQIVKTVLGMANRQPAAAAQHAGGYGYLVVGVEPGALNGVVPVDPEVLVGQVRAAVGDVIRWTPEYVSVDGVHVLIVIVDPPRPGDPIHYLRKQIDRYQPGTIFVRHTGRTDPATPADLDMLQSRLLERTPSLQLTVAATPPTIETLPDILTAAEQWVERRRPALLAARHQPPAPQTPAFGDLKSPLGGIMDAVGPTVEPDKRTKKDYTRQVEKILEKAKNVFANRAVWDLYRHTPVLLHVEVTNSTDLGYTDIQLVVHIPGAVKGFPDEWKRLADGDRPRFPSPPVPLGTPTVTDNTLFGQFAKGGFPFPQVSIPHYGKLLGPGPGYTVRDSGSVDVEFREFKLRPGQTTTLDPVPLFVREDPGTTLTATWYATAANIRGKLTGEFDITIAESTLDLTNLDHDLADE
jgi:hypothetical protein